MVPIAWATFNSPSSASFCYYGVGKKEKADLSRADRAAIEALVQDIRMKLKQRRGR